MSSISLPIFVKLDQVTCYYIVVNEVIVKYNISQSVGGNTEIFVIILQRSQSLFRMAMTVEYLFTCIYNLFSFLC